MAKGKNVDSDTIAKIVSLCDKVSDEDLATRFSMSLRNIHKITANKRTTNLKQSAGSPIEGGYQQHQERKPNYSTDE